MQYGGVREPAQGHHQGRGPCSQQPEPLPAPRARLELGTHRPGPGGELEVGRQLDVGAQQGEQTQQEVHDLQGQKGH